MNQIGVASQQIVNTFLVLFDLTGTFVFAVSGAAAAVKHRLDAFGVLVLCFAAGNAGGITRDIMIGAFPPAAVLRGGRGQGARFSRGTRCSNAARHGDRNRGRNGSRCARDGSPHCAAHRALRSRCAAWRCIHGRWTEVRNAIARGGACRSGALHYTSPLGAPLRLALARCSTDKVTLSGLDINQHRAVRSKRYILVRVLAY